MTSSQLTLHTERHVPVIEVTEGFHSGALVALDQLVNESGRVTVGSGLACDISLGDREVVDLHYRFSIHGNRASVEAVGADVNVNHTTVTKGTGYRCRLPIEISAGGSTVRVGYPGKLASSTKVSKRLLKITPLMALALVLVSVFLVPLVGVSEANQVARPLVEPAGVTLHEDAENPTTPVAVTAEPDVKSLLEEQLSNASLSHLSVSGQNSLIRVEGRIYPAEQRQWQQVREWFDQDFSMSHTLQEDITVLPDMPKPDLQIKALWLGDDPHIVSRDGSRIFPGDELKGGWVLDDITPEQVVLSRRGERYRLTL